MYGLIVKLTILPGMRDEAIVLLREGAQDMPGCSGYVIAKDAADENVLWVTEVWESEASHDASFTLRAVQEVAPRIRLLVANVEKLAVTEPVVDAARPG